ncbi:MAG: hypothetical protein FVQ80_17185 [Planctomycetes bacterium]|nr:hypothetical protein [Planctomycetota bacterium]
MVEVPLKYRLKAIIQRDSRCQVVGEAGAAEIHELLPKAGIIIVSMHYRGDYIARESTTKKLLHGFEVVLNGEYFIDSAVSRQVVKKLISSAAQDIEFADPAYKSLLF